MAAKKDQSNARKDESVEKMTSFPPTNIKLNNSNMTNNICVGTRLPERKTTEKGL
jgi:hypothetical protein